jgi:hypothetical protein
VKCGNPAKGWRGFAFPEILDEKKSVLDSNAVAATRENVPIPTTTVTASEFLFAYDEILRDRRDTADGEASLLRAFVRIDDGRQKGYRMPPARSLPLATPQPWGARRLPGARGSLQVFFMLAA